MIYAPSLTTGEITRKNMPSLRRRDVREPLIPLHFLKNYLLPPLTYNGLNTREQEERPADGYPGRLPAIQAGRSDLHRVSARCVVFYDAKRYDTGTSPFPAGCRERFPGAPILLFLPRETVCSLITLISIPPEH
jgi:hypothetical protein